jgi:hypothetical protein
MKDAKILKIFDKVDQGNFHIEAIVAEGNY